MLARLSTILLRAGILLVIVAGAQFRSARAVDPAVREAAVVLANSGIEALTAGRWADAIRELERALPLAELTGDRTLIAGCHRAIAKAHDGLEAYDAALRHYRAYLAVGLEEPLRRKEVEDRVAAIQRMREAEVTITVDALDAKVTIDGEDVRLSEEPIRLSLGRHTIRVTAPGFEVYQEEIALTGGESLRLAIRMRPLAPPTPPRAEVPIAPPLQAGDAYKPEASSGGTAWPWVTLGLGAVAGGLGTWLIMDGTADLQEVTDAQATPWVMTREEADALVADGDRKRLAGFITAGVGGALVITSIILFVTEGSGGEPATSAPTLSPLFNSHVTGLAISGGF